LISSFITINPRTSEPMSYLNSANARIFADNTALTSTFGATAVTLAANPTVSQMMVALAGAINAAAATVPTGNSSGGGSYDNVGEAFNALQAALNTIA
jgi:hypothetical protein